MLVTSRCAADTMPWCDVYPTLTSLTFYRLRRITAPWPSHYIDMFLLPVDNHDILRHTKSRQIHMGEKRQWDESRSPQWRYLLSKDSKEKRERQKREERMEQAEGDLKRGVSKYKRKAQERHRENRKLKSKSGREIVYSASPGEENSSYRNTEFIESHRVNENTKIFEIENEANTTTE